MAELTPVPIGVPADGSFDRSVDQPAFADRRLLHVAEPIRDAVIAQDHFDFISVALGEDIAADPRAAED